MKFVRKFLGDYVIYDESDNAFGKSRGKNFFTRRLYDLWDIIAYTAIGTVGCLLLLGAVWCLNKLFELFM